MGNVQIFNWRYEDGWSDISPFFMTPGGPVKEFREDMVGWFCHAYTDNHWEFEKWMKANMCGKYDATQRFNSGNPMITVWIADDQDASIFKLRWVCES
jgi:hypothetical protein